MVKSGLILVGQVLPGVVLVTSGWGWGDLAEFLRDPARTGLATVVAAAIVAAVAMNLDLHPLRRGTAETSHQSKQLAVLLVLSIFMLWFLPFADRRKIWTLQHEGWRYFGLVLCTMGVVVRLAGLKELGEYFSAYVTLQPGHRLVRSGIYRVVRHPLYLSLLLAPVGMALVLASRLALPIEILAVVFVVDRMKREECLLATEFGADFENYRRKTWRLIPYLV